MKVKVNVKTSPKVQEKYYKQVIAEAYAEMETMFQENKDLRVSEAHLRDDLACAQAQIEAQRQAILHRDEQLLNQFEEIKAWSSKYATVCADRDNLEATYKQVQESMAQMARNFNETRKELENEVKRVCKEKQDLYAQLADKDEEIESAEKVIESLETQLTRTELHNTLLESRLEETTAELVKHELNHYKDEAEEWKMTADRITEQYRELQAQFADLNIEYQELSEGYDALIKTKCDYAEEIDRLRHENKGLRHQMPLPEFMRQFIEMTREAVKNEFPDSGNS